MLCGYDAALGLPGNDAFGLDAPVSAAHLRCAMRHLYFDYSLVGVNNRMSEFVCVICEAFGWDMLNVSRRGTYYSDTPTNQHDKQPPADFI